MWSQTNKEFVEELVITNHNEYPYYVAHTCTYWGTGSTYGRPSFKVYFSKEPIKVVNEYTYTLSGESVCYTVNANNANQNSNEQRFNVSKQNAGTVKIDNYEFVYANAVASSGTLVPDVTATYNVKQSHFDGASLVVIMVLLGTMIWKLMKG